MLDVIVVGAGVAGLAAASRLAEAGRDVVVLEARERLGGRILTEPSSDSAAAIELGAEFLHGDAEPTEEIADRHGLTLVHLPDRRYQTSGTRIKELTGYWDELDRAMRALKSPRTRDRSLTEAIAARGARLSRRDRTFALQYASGYDAADPALVSERWLAEGGMPCDDVRELRARRILGGYSRLIDVLAEPIRPRILTGMIVSTIRWTRGRVDVECRDASGVLQTPFAARAVVITVPLGVLAAPPGVVGALSFDPPVRTLDRAIALGAMGDVVKLVLRFKEPFWLSRRFGEARKQPMLDGMSFIQPLRREPFSIWWTMTPVRSPLLVAWSAGPKATALAELSRDELSRVAVESLSEVFVMRASALRAQLVGVYYHDWVHDPFARGAYSYARVGGHRMSERLARPIQQTIWIAGEAADREGRSGTVHGAIASGYRAAKEILQ
ncbi:MAG TPA: NAD(P)/FAD-dependent oxidoreductase [Gemmatimonadaceae bacterium]